jgi:hypothetical protein
MASTTLTASLGVTIAAATPSTIVGEVPHDGTVSSVTYTPVANITGATSTARTLTLTNKGLDGNGTTAVATLAYITGTDGVDFDEQAFTLSATPANLVVLEGQVLAVVETVASTGTVNPGGRVNVVIERSLA